MRLAWSKFWPALAGCDWARRRCGRLVDHAFGDCMLLLIAAFAVGLFVHDVSPELTVDPITQTSAADVASSAADVLTAADVPTAAVASSANVLPANAAPIDALSSAFDVEFNFAARPKPLNVVW